MLKQCAMFLWSWTHGKAFLDRTTPSPPSSAVCKCGHWSQRACPADCSWAHETLHHPALSVSFIPLLDSFSLKRWRWSRLHMECLWRCWLTTNSPSLKRSVFPVLSSTDYPLMWFWSVSPFSQKSWLIYKEGAHRFSSCLISANSRQRERSVVSRLMIAYFKNIPASQTV